MVFSDLIFLFIFIPLFLLTYFLALGVDRTLLTPRPLRRRRHYVCTLRNAVLILFSLIFYAWGEPVYVLLMVGSVLLNYLLGMLIGAYDVSLGKRKAALILGIVLNVSILGVFKYAGLIATTLASFRLPFHDPHIVLPIGISFYIFQSISYLVDVYRREAPLSAISSACCSISPCSRNSSRDLSCAILPLLPTSVAVTSLPST